jgi:type II secretory pathway component GspD/PulD (secretin)
MKINPAKRFFTLALIAGSLCRAHASDKTTPALIQIGVEVVEVDETKTQKLGVEWINAILFADVPSGLNVGSFVRTPLAAAVQALIKEGAADLLANPKLVTRDGTTATFHAGGELPYATTTGSGNSVTIEFKPYGVAMKITPRLEEDNRIAIAFEAEVSGPDDQNGVTLSGNTVPGLRTRKVSSELLLTPGSSLTMAGLIQNQKQSTVTGVAGLMRIPFLGAFFRHKVLTNQRTSVVVFITPTILDIEKSANETALLPEQPMSTNHRPALKEDRQDDLLQNLDGTKTGSAYESTGQL